MTYLSELAKMLLARAGGRALPKVRMMRDVFWSWAVCLIPIRWCAWLLDNVQLPRSAVPHVLGRVIGSDAKLLDGQNDQLPKGR